MDNTKKTLNDDGYPNAESIQTSPNGKVWCRAKNRGEEGNTKIPKWKIYVIFVLAVCLFLHWTNLIFLIPIVLKCSPTSETAAYFFMNSPTYAKNTIGFDSELWINRYIEHIYLSIVIICCIVCLVVLISKFAVKKFCKEDQEKLDTFFDDLNRKELNLLGHWNTDELNEIKGRISDVISNIVFGSFKDDPIFNFQRSELHKHIRLVGSVSEGTKIRNPDEFDFVFIWPHLADSNTKLEDINKSPDDIKIWYIGNSVACSHLIERNVINKTGERHLISPSNLFEFFYQKIYEYVSHISDCKLKVFGPALTLYFDEMTPISGEKFCISVDLFPVISLSKSKVDHLLSKSRHKVVIDKVKYIYLSHIPTGREVVSSSDGTKVFSTCFTEKDTFSICLPHVENRLIKYLAEMQPKLITCYKILKDMQTLLKAFVYGEDKTAPYRFDLNSYHLKCLILEMAFEINEPHTKMSLSTMIIALWEEVLLSYSRAAGKGKVAIPTLLTRIENRYSLRSNARDKIRLRTVLKSKRDRLVSFLEKIVNDRTYNFEEYLEQYNDFVQFPSDSFVLVTKSRSFRRNFS